RGARHGPGLCGGERSRHHPDGARRSSGPERRAVRRPARTPRVRGPPASHLDRRGARDRRGAAARAGRGLRAARRRQRAPRRQAARAHAARRGRRRIHRWFPAVGGDGRAARPPPSARLAGRAMRDPGLATDYDGTIAHDGVVDDATVQAVQQAREAGLKLVLVTGRELSSLFNTFAHPDAFDRIVAENGAVLYEPGTKEVRTLASPPPPALIDMLQSGQVPLEIGHSIVATVTPHEHAVLEAIRALKIEWHVIFNKHAVMALPADVTK